MPGAEPPGSAEAIRLVTSPLMVEEGAGPTPVTVIATRGSGADARQARIVTVSVGAGDDSADAADYEPVRDFAIVIEAGARSAQGVFRLRPVENDDYEGTETVTVGGVAQGVPVIGADLMIVDNDPPATDRAAGARGRALGAVLTALGGALAGDAVDVIGTRFTATGSAVAVGGHEVVFGPHPGAAAEGGTGSVWGRGAASGLVRPHDGVTVDGAALSGYLGFDYGWRDPSADGVVGAAVVLSRAERVSYRMADDTTGTADLTMTAVLPYAHLRPLPGFGVWGMAGGGAGPVALRHDGSKAIAADVALRLVAGGGYLELAAWENVGVALEADGFLATLQSQSAALRANGEARRVRALVAGRGAWELVRHSHLRANVEIAGLWDGADQLGAEVGGGVEYQHTGIGLGVDARGRYLLAQNPEHREWGAGVTLRYAPAGTGLWFALEPSWGAAASRGDEQWASLPASAAEPGAGAAAPVSRAGLEVGYRVGERFEVSVAWTGEAPPAAAAAHRVHVGSALRW